MRTVCHSCCRRVPCRGVLFSDPIHSYRLLLLLSLVLVLVIAACQPPLSPRQPLPQQQPPALAPAHATPPTPPPDQRRQLLQLLRAAAALLLLLLRDPLSLSSASAQPPSPECPWALATLTNQQIQRQSFELDFQPIISRASQLCCNCAATVLQLCCAALG